MDVEKQQVTIDFVISSFSYAIYLHASRHECYELPDAFGYMSKSKNYQEMHGKLQAYNLIYERTAIDGDGDWIIDRMKKLNADKKIITNLIAIKKGGSYINKLLSLLEDKEEIGGFHRTIKGFIPIEKFLEEFKLIKIKKEELIGNGGVLK